MKAREALFVWSGDMEKLAIKVCEFGAEHLCEVFLVFDFEIFACSDSVWRRDGVPTISGSHDLINGKDERMAFKEKGLVLAVLLGLLVFFSMAKTSITTLWSWRVAQYSNLPARNGGSGSQFSQSIIGHVSHRNQPLRYPTHYTLVLFEDAYMQPSAPVVTTQKPRIAARIPSPAICTYVEQSSTCHQHSSQDAKPLTTRFTGCQAFNQMEQSLQDAKPSRSNQKHLYAQLTPQSESLSRKITTVFLENSWSFQN
ncbi:hypothetical protein V8G54_021234 [Vigna mungo]|uniref:Uncharacterized protein n=1 Tax=Vigna mungo TaxID=3915 RepID=A0AAQ3NFR9_VIGMU